MPAGPPMLVHLHADTDFVSVKSKYAACARPLWALLHPSVPPMRAMLTHFATQIAPESVGEHTPVLPLLTHVTLTITPTGPGSRSMYARVCSVPRLRTA